MTSAAPCPQGQTASRPSFAKVAAQTYKPQIPKDSAPSVKPSVAIPQPAIPANLIKPPTVSSAAAPAVRVETRVMPTEATENAGNTAGRAGQSSGASDNQTANAPELKEEEAAKLRPPIALVKFSAAEDSNTQLSSSDGSAKPPSLDGKSVASGTTFALDEKESLRPDDSASLRAVEEEDVTSPPESNAAGSRVGSDSEARAFRAQLHEIAVMGPQPQRGVVPGRFPVPIANGAHALYDPNQPPNGIGRSLSQPAVNGMAGTGPQNLAAIPDEKLIEALQSPRDRLFVVKIEQDFIDFIKDSRENEYNLPNCNTFYRMLAHRLADYYLLGHVVDTTMTGVRITRTPYCRIPPPLSQMVDVSKGTNTPPVDLPARKIMRRGDGTRSGTNTGVNSEIPSKAGSEVDGSDGGNDAGAKKDKSSMTREEREARYREARQRIFGSAEAEETESPDPAATSEEKGASRSSSASGKKKNKKQRNQDDDDGFEARSRFNAYYPGQYAVPGYTGDSTVYYSGYPTPLTNPQYSPIGPDASPPPNYGSPYPVMPQDPQAQYWPGQQYPSANGPMMYSNYQMQNGYDLSNDFQRGMQSFQSAGMPNQVTPKMANASMAGYPDPYAQQHPNVTMNQGWPPMNQQSSYPMSQSYAPNGPSNRPMSAPMQAPTPGAYQYGQFPPPTLNGKLNKNQHPIPGSYQRPPFNPQSQAFIPGSRNMLYQMGIHNGPQMMNAFSNYQMSQTQMTHQMPRPSPPTAPTQTFGPPFTVPQYAHGNSNSSPPNQSSMSSQTISLRGGEAHDSALSSQSSIAKYGTPSNLPARPPPTQQQAPKFTLPGHNLPSVSRVPSNPAPSFRGNTP
ncbi:hypothetical protein BU23DRAFT_456945 [Bimuria novae-zelandiae CBS 107.79]|uniref:SUZ domain-containing protein n=1 Tax=Bimuria novae-zelandiae CBS 107.79 TaxID=1447943 RepID=A0A6A5VFK3_9PLEO|nr:hypothetical protein BU23DRAFT_456945 [Bimuria novae-zelandiae CBS 107.79]